jgi:serine protease
VVLERLRKNPDVFYAVKDRVGHFTPVPDPVQSSYTVDLLTHESQWDEFTRPAGVMLESKAGSRDGAWAYTTGLAKKPVVVAVLDTGIALNDGIINNLVKDSEGNVWGWNFAANNNNLADETKSFHGTHVAGTIAGYGSVMSGMASGMFYESSVINAIYWAVGGDVPGVPTNIYPAKVLNMSFGVDRGPKDEVDYCDQALQEAVFFARKKGAILAVAAGNDNLWEHFNAPAVCNGTMKIASTGPEGLRSYFSNYGPGITLAAPGGDKRYGLWGGILSTVNPGGGYNGSGFDYYQGTSMATPHVAGVAGLIFSASDKALSPEQIEQILYTTTHDFGVSSDVNKSCIGK